MNDSPASLLVVEDDPSCALFVQQLVQSLGDAFPCTTHWANSAEEAIAELGRNHFELMLLDYRLPGVNGLQVLSQVRELPSEQQPAVVMLTGSGSESIAVEAMKRGAKDYLLKDGLDATPLMRALRSALAQKRLADQVAAYNAQMRSDIEMARHLQQSLLPNSYPVFPVSAAAEKSALRFVHRFIPATELAGDFFNVFALSDTKAGVLICDVMGHGIRSALVTAMMHALVENEAPRAAEPGPFLAALNRRLVRHIKPTEGPMFVTAFYAIVDIAERRLRYANAGHPRPLHLRRTAGTVELLPATRPVGPALGMFPDAQYASGESLLQAGDLLMLYTDGIYEAANEAGEEFGRQRLLQAATANIGAPGEKFCDALIEEVRRYAGQVEFADDVCLLGMEIAAG